MSLVDWDEPEYLELPGLRMAVFQAGTPQKTGHPWCCATAFPKSAIAGG